MKTLHFYNGIEYAREKNPDAPNTGSVIQSCLRVLNFISWGVSLWKNPKNEIIGYLRFKVMNSLIYSIQREVIKEFESLKSQL